jgi:fructose-specific phosphotransferase system IIC component
LHTLTIYGDMPSDFANLMIVPKKGTVSLPYGWVSDNLTDIKQGNATEVTGTITLKFAGAGDVTTALADETKTASVVSHALAATISGVSHTDIVITSLTQGSRRLGAEDDADAEERRLATSHLIVGYTIITDTAIVAADIDPATLMTQLKAAATSLGFTAFKTALDNAPENPGVSAPTSEVVVGTDTVRSPVGSLGQRSASCILALVMISLAALLG